MLIGAPSGSATAPGAAARRGLTSVRARPAAPPGFTLIEILIVISIIALLSSMILVAINKAKGTTNEAVAKQMVGSLHSALEAYIQDEADYPGSQRKLSADDNHFPDLYNALLGERRPDGPGGRGAPYMNRKQEQVVCYDEDSETYVQSTKDELDDYKVPKYIVDPWGNPYVYRANKGRQKEDFMKNRHGADIYSLGPNEIDDIAEGNEEGDDIGNW